ncbi:MAG: exo-alpha-sialidase [Bacteroidota bacterium]
MKIKNILSIALLSTIAILGSCNKEYEFTPPSKPTPVVPQPDAVNNIMWSGDFHHGGGGYPRFAEDTITSNPRMILGMDTGEGVKLFESHDNGITFGSEVIAAPNSGVKNEGKGNVFPLVLPNKDIVVAYRHLNDIDKYDQEPDGVKWWNIDLVVSKDGGLSYEFLSSALNDPRNPYNGDEGLESDQSEGAWEPFLYYNDELEELWCLYSRQNDGRDLHPLLLTMKRSTDYGATWGEEEVVTGIEQFGALGSAGMNGVVRTNSGQLIVVFETQSKKYNNAFSIGMVTSDDNGATWSEIKTVYDYPTGSSTYGAGAPYIAVLPDGKLIVTFQFGTFESTQFGYVMSDDNGSTWTSAYRMWGGEAKLWNTVFVSSKGLIYLATSGVNYKIGNQPENDATLGYPFYLFPKSTNDYVVDIDLPWDVEVGKNVNIHTWSFAPGATTKMWKLIDNGDGYFLLKSVHAEKYGYDKVVDLSGDDRNVHLWDNLGTDNQLWTVESISDDYYKITNKKFPNKVLTIENNAVGDGKSLIAIDEEAGLLEGQQFIAIPIQGYDDPFAEWLANQ